jgi:hypothetical protein
VRAVATRPRDRASRRRTARRDRPFLNTNFDVTLEPPGAACRSIGFCEVILPELPVQRPATTAAAELVSTVPRLVLRRGFDGTTDLRDWWKDARRRKTPRPWTVTVCLLAEDCATVVATWIFSGARPVSLAYSPLHAGEPAVLIETVALEFEDVELR